MLNVPFRSTFVCVKIVWRLLPLEELTLVRLSVRFSDAKIIHLLISSIINAIFLIFIKQISVVLTLVSDYANNN